MTTPESEWTLVATPRKSRRYAIGVAILLVVVHVTFAILLRGDSTGVYFRLADQLAFAGIGCLLAAAVLLLTRPRLRVGPRGIAVRNVLGERIVDWDLYEGCPSRTARRGPGSSCPTTNTWP